MEILVISFLFVGTFGVRFFQIFKEHKKEIEDLSMNFGEENRILHRKIATYEDDIEALTEELELYENIEELYDGDKFTLYIIHKGHQ